MVILTVITMNDSEHEVIAKMGKGNPGAMNAIMEMLTKAGDLDPDNALGGLGYVLALDTYGIYGTDIYVLWNDICGKDLVKTLAVLRATQLGMFSSDVLKDACSGQDYSGRKMVPVEELYTKVKERLPKFNTYEQN